MNKEKHLSCQHFWQDVNGFINAYSTGIVVWLTLPLVKGVYVCSVRTEWDFINIVFYIWRWFSVNRKVCHVNCSRGCVDVCVCVSRTFSLCHVLQLLQSFVFLGSNAEIKCQHWLTKKAIMCNTNTTYSVNTHYEQAYFQCMTAAVQLGRHHHLTHN